MDIKRQEGVTPALVRSEDLAGMSQVWEMSHGRFCFSVFSSYLVHHEVAYGV